MKGYGREFMKRAEKILIDAGCPKVGQQIRTSKRKAIEFYKSIGFKIDHVVSMGKGLDPEETYKLE